jgi:hypothetical protein
MARSDPETALAIARAECKSEGWPWLEPVTLQSDARNWIVATACDASNRGARILISQATGEVVCKSFVRRSNPEMRHLR